MADTKHVGNDYRFYWSDTDPGTNTEQKDPSNYTPVGLVTSKGFNSARTLVAGRTHDSAEGADDVPTDDVQQSINLDVNHAKDGNAGQTLLYDAHDAKTKGFWLVTPNVVGEYARYGQAYIENLSETSPQDGLQTSSFTLKIQGVSTRFQINT